MSETATPVKEPGADEPPGTAAHRVPGLPRLGLSDRFAALPMWARVPVVLLVVAFAFYLPFLNILPFAYIRTDLTSGGSDWGGVLFLIVIYMIVAVGLNVVIGLAGLLDLGYIGFYAIGAYSVALFGSPSSPVTEMIADKFGLAEGWAVPFVACVPIALAFALASGVLLGAPTLRLRGDYLAIVTMGFGEIIRILSRNVDQRHQRVGRHHRRAPAARAERELLLQHRDRATGTGWRCRCCSC